MITLYVYNKPAMLTKPDGYFSYADFDITRVGWHKKLPLSIGLFIKLVYGGHALKRYEEIHTKF